MSHAWKTLTCTALLGLTLASSGEARTVKPAPVSTLTTQEHVCQMIGELDYQSALSRDAGVPYLRLVALLRSQRHNPDPLMAIVVETAIKNSRPIYETPSLSPTRVRNLTELLCTQMMEQAMAKQETTHAQQR